MKLGKIVDGEISLIEVENGKEVSGKKRKESTLYSLGYKKACPYIGEEQGETEWVEYPTCLVEVVKPIEQEEDDEGNR